MTSALMTYGLASGVFATILTVWHRMRVRWRDEDALDAANRREDEL